MKQIQIKSVILGALLAVVSMFSIGAVNGIVPGITWEYKVVTGNVFQDELSKAINSSVNEGWSFVSASGPNTGNWGMAVLKREKK